MVIQHNLAGLNSKRNQRINESKLRKNLEKLSSGYRINRSGDDAAGLAISEQLRYRLSGSSQAQDNIGDAINLLQTAEGAMNEVHAILQRMHECCISSSNGIHDEDSRKALDIEVGLLKDEVDRIAEDTDFYFVGMLGDGIESQFQIGPSPEEIIEVQFPNISIGTGELNLDGVSVETQEDAQKSIDLLKDAIGYVSEERGRLGACQRTLESAERSLGIAVENMTVAESRIRDTDMADEITSYTKNNIVFEASRSMMTQANAMTQNVLDLLQ